MNKLYDWLVKNKIKKISDHELSRWPKADSEELKSQNRLEKAENGTQIYCDSCDEYCPIDDYDIIEIPEKGTMAAFVCSEKEEMGFITAPLSRRRYWRFNYARKAKRTSITVHKAVIKNEAARIEKAFFVYLTEEEFSKGRGNKAMKPGIAFFFDKELKLLPFQKKSHVVKVLPKFIDGSMTSTEIQQYAESDDKPRFIVKNMNKSILSKLHKVGFTQIDNDKFVRFNEITNSYTIEPKIIPQQQYEDFLETFQK